MGLGGYNAYEDDDQGTPPQEALFPNQQPGGSQQGNTPDQDVRVTQKGARNKLKKWISIGGAVLGLATSGGMYKNGCFSCNNTPTTTDDESGGSKRRLVDGGARAPAESGPSAPEGFPQQLSFVFTVSVNPDYTLNISDPHSTVPGFTAKALASDDSERGGGVVVRPNAAFTVTHNGKSFRYVVQDSNAMAGRVGETRIVAAVLVLEQQ